MLEEKELKLISEFRENARNTLTKISRKTRIPVSTIYDKLKQFEDEIIKRHTCILDFKKLGFDIKVNIMVKTNSENREGIQGFLIKNPRVNSVFRINNGYDFLAEGIFRNMKELQDFSEDLDKFKPEDKKEYFVLEDVKREDFLTEKHFLMGNV